LVALYAGDGFFPFDGEKIALGSNPNHRFFDWESWSKFSKILKELSLNDPMFVKHGGDDGYERKYVIDYRNKKNQSIKGGNYFSKDMKYEEILKVLDKKIPLKIHAHRADDIITAIRIKKEFKINITIEHGTEGHLIVDEIVENDIPVLVGPTLGERSKNELTNKTFATPGILSKAGVKMGIISDHGVVPTQYLPLYAGLAIREGMSEIEALKSITINPAQILGIDDRVGSLEEGKDADIVIFSGSPFDTRSKIDTVLIDGNSVN
jgi:imidazolonepropionase-like amidohydrolase